MPCACVTTTASLTTTVLRRRVGALRCAGDLFELEQQIAGREPAIEVRAQDPEAFAVGDDHRRDETAGPAPQQLQVEAQQHIAGAHAVALAHLRRKTLAAQGHGIDAHVHQDFRAAGRAQGNGMARGRDRNHLAVAGRAQLVAGRIERRALAQHGAREHFVGNFRERAAPAGERREDLLDQASASDELEAADHPDGIDLAARELEAQVVSAFLDR